MVRGRAYAKVNLGLRVGRRRADGFHPLRGIFQSIDLSDELSLELAEADRITADGGGPVPDDFANLAWRALAAVPAGTRVAVACDLSRVGWSIAND